VIRRRVIEALPEQVRALDAPVAPGARLEAELDDFLKHATDRYLQAATPATVARHFLIRRQLSADNVLAWHLVPEGGRGLSELTVCAYDAPGLFHNICGAWSAKGIKTGRLRFSRPPPARRSTSSRSPTWTTARCRRASGSIACART
jgi:UTP:GlnB (protein PII) uridylyltransferase